MSDQFSFFVPITKVSKNNDGTCTVSGYCTTPALDLDGEIISLDAVKKAAPGYWEWRNIRRMHSSDAVGVGKELNIDDKGAFLTAKIINSDAVKGCLEGVYKGFSIGGKKLEKKGNTITEIDWIETSIVDRPANPECKFDVAKKAKDSFDGAYLLKPRKPTNPAAKALLNMSKAALILAKSEDDPDPGPLTGPEAKKPKEVAAKEAGETDVEMCAKHGIKACAKCAAKAAKKEAKKQAKSSQQGGENGDYIEPPAKDDKKTQKRDFSADQRRTAAAEGDALPDGSFPIKNKKDLSNAQRLLGHSKDKPAARRLISRRARELGVKIPDGATKKEAHAIVKAAESRLRVSAPTSFLSLKKGAEKLAHENGLRPASLELGRLSPDSRNDDEEELNSFNDFLNLRRGSSVPGLKGETVDVDFNQEGFEMDDISKFDASILDIVKRSMQPSQAQRMSMAQSNMKKANKARKAAKDEIENVHKMLKKAYVAKDAMAKAGKKPADGDSDDLECMTKAMAGLAKAYAEIGKAGTFMKASREHLAKAAGRSGQREQEPSHGEPGYEVPRGVTDLSSADLAGASPGNPGRPGSQPPAYPGSEGTDPASVYAGKAAKFAKNGQLSTEMAALLAENAALEARAAAVHHLPQTGRRPFAADMTKFANAGGNGNDKVDPVFKAMKDANVNPNDLMIAPDSDGQEDPRRRDAVAKTVGMYLHPDSGNGRSAILDSSFKGRAA